ncbi:MAG TPA: hypothetical protein VF469_28595 [Kofleriaceae bacterium]
MSTSSRNNTGITLTVIGGGALLLWLLWRGRGKGKGKSGDGEHSSPPAAVTVWVLSGDRLALERSDGVSVDLATTVDLARAAGRARVRATGDARHGWVEQVKDALLTAGVKVDSLH